MSKSFSMLNPHKSQPPPGILAAFAILVLGILALQASQYHGQPYRLNEDWSVYWTAAQATQGNPIQQILEADYLPLNVWISLFGTAPAVTRYLSALVSLGGFALLYRLCADLLNHRTALIAVVLLGTLSLAQTLTYMAQPYAALVLIVPGLLLLWRRWLHNPGGKNSALYVGFAIAAVYVCTYSSLLVAAQAIFFLIFVPWQRTRGTRAMLLFAAVAVACLPRIVVFSQINPQTGLPYSSWFAPDLLRAPISIAPGVFAQVILLLALAAVSRVTATTAGGDGGIRLRWNAKWPMGYPLAMLVLFGGLLALLGGLPIGVSYGIAALPVLVIPAAMTIASFRWPLQAVIVILFAAGAVAGFHPVMPDLPYQTAAGQALAADNSADKLVVAAPYPWQHAAFAQYGGGTGQERTFHILRPDAAEGSSAFLAAERTARGNDADTLERFSQFVDQAPAVWLYLEQMTLNTVTPFINTLLEAYDEVSPAQRSWYGDQPPAYGDLRKYIRIPDELRPIFRFGDQLTLQAWTLRQSVNVSPCQWITVESWWSADQPIAGAVSMTLVMANAADGQGIANSDGTPTGRDLSSLTAERARVDERSLQVPCDIQPGEYPLLVGVYSFEGEDMTIKRLPVSLPDGTPLGSLAYLTTLFVNP